MRSTIAAMLAGMAAFGIVPATGTPASAPASAKIIEQEDDLFVTRDSATVKANPEETWLALVAPSKWWSDSHTWSGDAENIYLSPQGGGCFCELLPKADAAAEGIQRGSVQHMVVMQADPGKVLRMRGGLGPLQSEPAEGVLTITLKPVDGGTRILWEYVVGGRTRFETPEIAETVDGVMSLQLARLVKLLGALESGEAESNDDPDTDADEDDEVQPVNRRIGSNKVLSPEEAIDQMAGGDGKGDDE